jgi:hypothetical protein
MNSFPPKSFVRRSLTSTFYAFIVLTGAGALAVDVTVNLDIILLKIVGTALVIGGWLGIVGSLTTWFRLEVAAMCFVVGAFWSYVLAVLWLAFQDTSRFMQLGALLAFSTLLTMRLIDHWRTSRRYGKADQ